MKELVEKIGKQIDTDKEVITVLPRNGIKSIKTLLETIKEMTDKYQQVNEMLLKEIEEITNTNYEVGDIIKVENLIAIIEDLKNEYDDLKLDFEEYKQDVEDNYKPIRIEEQI